MEKEVLYFGRINPQITLGENTTFVFTFLLPIKSSLIGFTPILEVIPMLTKLPAEKNTGNKLICG